MKFKITIIGLVCSIIAFAYLGEQKAVASAQNSVQNSSGARQSPLKAKEIHHETTQQIIYTLQHHYKKLTIDDELSNRIFERYFQNLDTNKSIFTIEDIKQFEKYRHLLDDQLLDGDLTAAYEIYNFFRQKYIDRLKKIITNIETNFDSINLDTKGLLVINSEELIWAKNEAELDTLWDNRLINTIIGMKLSEKEDEDIKERLTKRYTNQLARITQTNNEDVFQSFINSFVELYDPHTQYLSPRTSENFNINMSLSLEGIGAVLKIEDEYVLVDSLVTGGPADLAGELQPGDRIVGVAQGRKKIIDVVGWRLDDVVSKIRGKKGTIVRLELIGSGEKDVNNTDIISIERDKVKLENRAARATISEDPKTKKKIGVIEIPTFYIDFKAQSLGKKDYKSSTRDVKKLLEKLSKDNVDGIVIDLRNNGGGSLQEANSLIGLFISTGPTVQIKRANGKVELQGDVDSNIFYDGPLLVLVNRLSASASEIFAGAIQDYGRGVIVGVQTFGKGTVQTLRKLVNGELKLTEHKYYRISGESSQNRGILPDINLPDLYASEDIGESSLPNALPWDLIPKAFYRSYGNLSPYIEPLSLNHNARIEDNADFIYIKGKIKADKEYNEKITTTLNYTQRAKERKDTEDQYLALYNKKRLARKESTFESFEELDNHQEEIISSRKKNKKLDYSDDPFMIEAINILTDFIDLSATSTNQERKVFSQK